MRHMRSQVVHISAYAPGDGLLSFIAFYADGPQKGHCAGEPPSLDECLKVLPAGWEMYKEHGRWRAKPMKAP
jgi:hypothetical protein